jgi:hypothetical protein
MKLRAPQTGRDRQGKTPNTSKMKRGQKIASLGNPVCIVQLMQTPVAEASDLQRIIKDENATDFDDTFQNVCPNRRSSTEK